MTKTTLRTAACLVFFMSLAIVFRPAVGLCQRTERSLRESAEPLFQIGVGIGMRSTRRADNWPLLTHHFGIVTPENCMKPQATQAAEGTFTLEEADRFVQFANGHDVNIVGHCLVWAKDDRTPTWFFRDGEKEASSDVLLGRMRTHINTIVRRYKGTIKTWDVVNEALADGSEGFLRDSGWTRATGEEFLVQAFLAAHDADPDSYLIYNDYRCDTEGKRKKLVRLVKMLKAREVPIDAVGLQGHYELDAIPYDGLEELLREMRALNVQVVISELDIDVVKRGSWWAENGRYREELASFDPYKAGCPQDILDRQAAQYARLFSLFARYSDVIERVSFWNLHDGQSWLNYFPWRRTNHPLLFDRDGQTKPAFTAVVSELEKSIRRRP